MSEVRLGILEAEGRFSFLRMDERRSAGKNDGALNRHLSGLSDTTRRPP